MGFFELFMIGVGLAMDAFAVAVGKGLSLKKVDVKVYLTIGLYFGIFQGLMPFLGYVSGRAFGDVISSFSGIVTFVLLCFVGGNMIREAFKNESDEGKNDLSFWFMIVLAIATSIDAFAVGITFAFYKIDILFAVLLIGAITFLLSMLGVKIGKVFGNKYEKGAQILGGVILIFIGVKAVLI